MTTPINGTSEVRKRNQTTHGFRSQFRPITFQRYHQFQAPQQVFRMHPQSGLYMPPQLTGWRHRPPPPPRIRLPPHLIRYRPFLPSANACHIINIQSSPFKNTFKGSANVGTTTDATAEEEGEIWYCNNCDCSFSKYDEFRRHNLNDHSDISKQCETNNKTEDLQRWLDARRAKYPTKANIEKRYEDQKLATCKNSAAKTKKTHGIFNRNNVKYDLFSKVVVNKRPTESKQKTIPKVRNINDCSSTASMFPFKGVSGFYNCLNIKQEHSDDDDTNWQLDQKSNSIPLDNSLGILMKSYSTTESSGEECERVKDRKTDEKKNQRQEKRHRTKRRRQTDRKMKEQIKPRHCIVGTRIRKRTLLEKLLENEIQHERNILLQCIQYIVHKNV